ncbi:MAG: hypothetical protein KIH44_008930 [Octadecabacter sp.]|nr:hypothetical protein [Octadecabacter sp.]
MPHLQADAASANIRTGNGGKVRYLILGGFVFAAVRMNDRFSCCVAAWKSTLLN